MSKAKESIDSMEKFHEKIYEDGITWLFGHHCLECGHLTFAQHEVKDLAKYFYELGYHQTEKDLLENKHKKSWRLDEKLWKGIKDIEEASYQYMYDASNDWAYDIPTWEDVQDAFKAGGEWKENLTLTWEDMRELHIIFAEIDLDIELCNTDIKAETLGYYQEVLKRFKDYKERKQ